MKAHSTICQSKDSQVVPVKPSSMVRQVVEWRTNFQNRQCDDLQCANKTINVEVEKSQTENLADTVDLWCCIRPLHIFHGGFEIPQTESALAQVLNAIDAVVSHDLLKR